MKNCINNRPLVIIWAFILLITFSANDLISLSLGLSLKPGFIFSIIFLFFSLGILLKEKKFADIIYAKDIPIIFWLFLCLFFCIENGTVRNYAYTLAAFVYVGIVLSARSNFYSYNKQNILNSFIYSGIIISVIGLIQFISGLTGWGEYFFIRQWWYEGIIARSNGLLYEPSYYGLAITPFVLFSFILTGVKNYNGNLKTINILFLFSSAALIVSSSRVSIAFNILSMILLSIYKLTVFKDKTIAKKDFFATILFVTFSYLFFFLINNSVNYLAEKNIQNQNILSNNSHINTEKNLSNYTDSIEEKNLTKIDKKSEIVPPSSSTNSPKENNDLNNNVNYENTEKLEEMVPQSPFADSTKGSNDSNNNISNENTQKSETDLIINKEKPYYQNVFTGTGLEGEASHSITNRWHDMTNTWNVAKQHLINGVGLGNIAYEIAKNKGIQSITGDILKNNEGLVPVIEIMAATGIIGLILLSVWLLNITLPGIFSLFKSSCHTSDHIVIAALSLAILSQFFLMQFNQNILRMYFWINIFILMVFVYSKQKNIE